MASIDVEKLRAAIGATEEPLWNVGDVATRYNVPKSWVYLKSERGEIPSVRLGKYRRFVPEEVRKWFAAQQAGAR